MSRPLANPPVYFTVAQVRFNTVLKLSEYLPSIQDVLRHAGYPAFNKQDTIALQINPQDGMATPQPVTHEQYFFADTGQTHSFVLNSGALTFQSTDYGTYERFSKGFLKGLELLHEVVKLDFTERVGLRYLDYVCPKADDTLDRYLVPEAQGLNARMGGQPVHAFVEMLNVLGVVNLRSRILTQDGRLAFPPDLQPQGLKIQHRFTEANGKHAIIDTDGFVLGRELFSLEAVSKHLEEIHDVISKAFRATVTPYALNIWSQQ